MAGSLRLWGSVRWRFAERSQRSGASVACGSDRGIGDPYGDRLVVVLCSAAGEQFGKSLRVFEVRGPGDAPRRGSGCCTTRFW
jgi:hypothetical protein